jgi:DNA-binding transcriptional ArsR family regulator
MVEKSIHLDRVFQALADPTRRAIIARLAHGHECTISELCVPFAMSLAAVSKHVQVLERAGLVRRRVSGRQHFCRLHQPALADAHSWLAVYRALF